ncbi:MAG: hypothetical protein ABL888_12055 [Pirellulaceae bacterium]
MAQLTKEEIVTLQTLSQKGQSGRAIARQHKVTEGAIRVFTLGAASLRAERMRLESRKARTRTIANTARTIDAALGTYSQVIKDEGLGCQTWKSS